MNIQTERYLDNLCKRFGTEFIASLMIEYPHLTCEYIGEIANEMYDKGDKQNEDASSFGSN